MKINRFIALAAIALLVVGALSAFSSKVFASGGHKLVAQSDACAQDQADGTEIASTTDTDKVDLQCGDQNSPDEQEAVGATDTDKVDEQVGDQNEADGAEAADAADTDKVDEQVGDQNGPDTGVEAPEVQATVTP